MTAIEYIEESGVPEAMWPNLAEWFGWFEKQGMVGIVRDEEGIAGVALARCIRMGKSLTIMCIAKKVRMCLLI